jgi:hypothetical protein
MPVSTHVLSLVETILATASLPCESEQIPLRSPVVDATSVIDGLAVA